MSRVETRWSCTRRALTWHPGEHLALGCTYVAPESSEVCSIAENDAPCHPTPSLSDRLSDHFHGIARMTGERFIASPSSEAAPGPISATASQCSEITDRMKQRSDRASPAGKCHSNRSNGSVGSFDTYGEISWPTA